MTILSFSFALTRVVSKNNKASICNGIGPLLLSACHSLLLAASHCTSHAASGSTARNTTHTSLSLVLSSLASSSSPIVASRVVVSHSLAPFSRDILSHRLRVLSSLALLPLHCCHALSSLAPSSSQRPLAGCVIAFRVIVPCIVLSYRLGIAVSRTVSLTLSPPHHRPCFILARVPKNNPVIFVNAILGVIMLSSCSANGFTCLQVLKVHSLQVVRIIGFTLGGVRIVIIILYKHVKQ
jgi:hypothetical protein